MKKIYVCLIGLFAVGAVNAQKSATVLDSKKNPFIQQKAPKGKFDQLKGVTIWSNDFSNAADWATDNDPAGTPPHTAGDWSIVTDVNAAPVAALNPAGHTTAANGYAIIDSDAAGATSSQNAIIYTVAPIDLSANPQVVMTFQQTHRRYAESTYVIYSLDGGATWGEVEVNANQTVNTNTTNPAQVQVDLSSAIGGQAAVHIGFKYTGQYDWFWAVDDVKLMTPDDYDLAIVGAYWGSTGFWGARLPYYKIPLAQIAPIDFSGVVSNLGALTQNDVVFTAALASGAYTGTSAPGTLANGATDTLDATTQLTPPATVANHVVNLSVSSSATDAAPANNAITNAATISVNNTIYARDLGTVASGSYNQGQGFEVGNIFDMYASAELSTIDLFVNSAAVAGAEIYVKLYSIDAATGDFVFVDESAPYTLTAANLGQTISLPLSAPAILNANESYLVVAGSNGDGGASNDLVVGTAGVSEAQTSFYLDLTDNTWYYTTSTPMVRMNFSPANVEEVNTVNLSVYPNPASDVITVSSTLTEGTITVTDVAGKLVKSTELNGLSTTINTTGLNNGVYYVTVSNGSATSTEKVVVKK
jgi:hypothetical protein